MTATGARLGTLVAVFLGLSVCGTPSVRAYHTESVRTVSGTAFTLRAREWQVGLFRVDYGPIPQLMIGTYVAPWFVLFPNLQLKARLFQSETWAVSIRPGLFYINSAWPASLYGASFGGTQVKLWVVPIEGYVSVLIRPRYALTLTGVYTAITGRGRYDPEDFRGTAAASNAQIGLGFEWRINDLVALIFQGRLVAFQEAGGAGRVEVEVDDRTTAQIEAQGNARVFDARRGFSISVATLLSWEHLNLRLGIGYGTYNVPGFNVVIPERHPFPVADLFWRFRARKRRVAPRGHKCGRCARRRAHPLGVCFAWELGA